MAKKPKTNVKKKKNAANLKVNKEKLESTLKKQWIIKAIELMKQGYANSFIRDYIRDRKEGSKSDDAINTILAEANAEIVASQFSKAQEVIPLHIARYNRIIEKCLAVQDADDMYTEEEAEEMLIENPKQYWYLREKKVRAYSDAINTLIQKEELLQYHNKDFNIQINIEEETEINQIIRPSIDVSRLDFEEQLQLLELMKKAKKNDFDLLAITQGEQAKEEDKIIEAVVTSVPKANVEDIKIEKLPEPPVKSIVTASDPTIRLRQSLALLAAQRFKEAGGQLTDDEEKLINKDGKK